MIDSISSEKEGLVELKEGFRHNMEDGDEVVIWSVDGMKHKTDDSLSINETTHKVKVKTPSSFTISDTTIYGDYT